MENKAVSDTGPIIHLSEINLQNALNIFSAIIIPEEVFNELKKNNSAIPRKAEVIKLNYKSKGLLKILVYQNELDMGESAAISLALQQGIANFITDDLDARIVAKNYGLEVHGTIGIILRAFRERVINKETAIKKIKSLPSESSLFITQDLINKIVSSVEEFKK